MYKRLLAVAALAALSPWSAANAFDHGWYFGIEAGADQPSDVDVTCALCLPSTVSFDTGVALMSTAGVYVAPNLHVELEAGYRADKESNNSDDVSEITLMANALYDIHLTDDFKLSLGGGLGADRIHNDFIGDSDTTFAYQFVGGFSWALSPHDELFVNYRYMNVGGPTLNNGFFDIDFSDGQHQTLTLGIRFGMNTP